MNKTQQELINRAKSYGGAASVVAGSGRGARGGRFTFGSRERSALMALVEAGKVIITHRDKDIEYNSGNSIHSTSFRYELVA